MKELKFIVSFSGFFNVLDSNSFRWITQVPLESLLVGYQDLHFKINYKLWIIHIHYEPMYSGWYEKK